MILWNISSAFICIQFHDKVFNVPSIGYNMEEIKLKKCSWCGEDKPATSEYYNLAGIKSHPLMLRGECKLCEKRKRCSKIQRRIINFTPEQVLALKAANRRMNRLKKALHR